MKNRNPKGTTQIIGIDGKVVQMTKLFLLLRSSTSSTVDESFLSKNELSEMCRRLLATFSLCRHRHSHYTRLYEQKFSVHFHIPQNPLTHTHTHTATATHIIRH